MSTTLTYDGTRDALYALLYRLVAGLSSSGGTGLELYVRGIKLRVGMVALACVQEAFIDKADGGTGEDGIKWPPLKKETIAARRMGPGDKASMRGYGDQNGRDVLGRMKRGFLTPAQDKRWRMIFATRKAMMMAKHGMSEEAASARAGQIAWATLKAEGAKTKLEVLGNRKVQMLRDTGRLFNSLSPGLAGADAAMRHPLTEPPPPPMGTEESDRVLREGHGTVIVGSNVDYAARQHQMRPLWPKEGLPSSWEQQIERAAHTGILDAITMILQGRG